MKVLTVFQGEIYAITMLIYELLEKDLHSFKNVCIFTYSLGALQVLQTRTTGSALVNECLEKIVALSRKIKVNISWIPAHSGYEGNEKADKLAKKATELHCHTVEPGASAVGTVTCVAVPYPIITIIIIIIPRN